jgi:hypothetical protein
MPIFTLSCGKATPERVVKRYLEEIGKTPMAKERIEAYTTEHFREDVIQNALIAEIKAAKGNYLDLLTPLMSEEDARLVDEYYDFKVMYREFVEDKLALVKVFIKPVLRSKVEVNKALESETLHPLLKQELKDQASSEFLFKLKLIDEAWKIDNIIYPPVLETVIKERTSATVTIPIPREEEQPASEDDDAA